MLQHKQISIPEFYRGKTVFITGGSGFMGKVLIEKLLRSCPDVNKIYLLMRIKKGRSSQERINEIISMPLFDKIRENNPNQLKKISIVNGNSMEVNLGLSLDDRKLLINETNIIFHAAASVRFDDPLDFAIKLNTRSTRDICLLALEMKKLAVLVYISTAYSNCDRQVVDEKLYPAVIDWRKAIMIAEIEDRNVMNVLTKKFIDPLPNTYVFSKSLSEQVVNDLCIPAKIPAVIFRPSVVVSSLTDPFPGWVDGFHGLVGIFSGCLAGAVVTFYTSPSSSTDNIPVDHAIKGLVNAAWYKATSPEINNSELIIYNCTNNGRSVLTMEDIYNFGIKNYDLYPLNYTIFTPSGSSTSWFWFFYLQTIIYQIIPAVIIDSILKIKGGKPYLLNLQRRVFVANIVLNYYLTRTWSFLNKNYISLGHKKLLNEDLTEFGYDENLNLETSTFLAMSMLGIRRYLFKQKDEDLPQARRRVYIKFYFLLIIRYIFYLLAFWVILKYLYL